MTELATTLIEAIQHGRLGTVAGEYPDDDVASLATAACRAIGIALRAEREHVIEVLADAGVDATVRHVVELPQRHSIDIDIDPVRDNTRAVAGALEAVGFRRHPTWTSGADRSFWATSDQIVCSRTSAWTTVVRLHRAPRRALPPVFRPRPADWDFIALPEWGWWAYSVVRPVRLALDRIGVVRGDHAALEPFLATPMSLIDPLLDLAEVGPDDVVADLGCGDGRILIEAARRRGCRAIGVEYSHDLVARARRSVTDHGLDARVSIVEGDGRDLSLADVDVVLLFLPMVVAASVVPATLSRLPPGGRVVTHEQSPLSSSLSPPDVSRPLFGSDAVSVGHRWDADGGVHSEPT